MVALNDKLIKCLLMCQKTDVVVLRRRPGGKFEIECNACEGNGKEVAS